MMSVQFICDECGSGVEVYPSTKNTLVVCDVCNHNFEAHFTPKHEASELETCPKCERKDFYIQKDFNRKLGVLFFVVAAILSIWTYGLSLVALFILDFFLFQRLRTIAVCYKCNTIFRNASNFKELAGFNHEMNDRIVYSDHDFDGKKLEH